jgi:hypothetical protein
MIPGAANPARWRAASSGELSRAAVTLAAFEHSAQPIPGALAVGADAGYHSAWLEHAVDLSEQSVDIGNCFQHSD